MEMWKKLWVGVFSEHSVHEFFLNPLPPTVAMATAIKHPAPDWMGLRRHLYFLTSGHSDAQGWASECPDVKNTHDNPVWHLYPCGNSGRQRVNIGLGLYFVDLRLEVVSSSRQPLRYIWRWICRKPFEHWFGSKGLQMGNGIWLIEWSHDRWRHVTLKGQTRDPNILRAQYLENGWI